MAYQTVQCYAAITWHK